MVKLKLLVVLLFAAFTAALLLTDNAANPHARAFSAGRPQASPTRRASSTAPTATRRPRRAPARSRSASRKTTRRVQTYDITVTHATADPTRVRWGFQLTALDGADEKAGSFSPADELTRVINGEGPFPAREYVEHTSNGTFPGQQNGASWTFRWSAPAEDVGPVTFYVAGNQANGDGNSSGDNIYFTFASSSFQAPAPDFRVTVTPTSRTAVRGTTVSYDVTVTPLGGFTGTVTLNLSGLPPNAISAFEPASVQLNDSSAKTSVLSVTAAANTPTGASTLNVNATSGQLTHTTQATLNVVSPTDADLVLTQTVSPNPVQANTDIRFTINIANKGPAKASAVDLNVILPFAFHTFTEGALGERCGLSPAANSVIYSCHLSDIPSGESATVDFTVRTSSQGVLQTTTTVRALENDPFPADNRIVLALPAAPQSASPSMTVPGLGVRTVVSGLDQPTSMAFVGPNDFFVLEKATGRVVRVQNGVRLGAVLDLAVNSASERGLLGIALHPNVRHERLRLPLLDGKHDGRGHDRRRRGAAARQPRRPLRLERLVAHASTATLIRLRALQTGRRAALARQPQRRRPPLRPRRQALRLRWATTGGAASCRTSRAARRRVRRPHRGRRPVRRPRAGRRAPHRRHPPPQRRRHDADRQPLRSTFDGGARRGRRDNIKRSSPTASATASGWTSTPSAVSSGRRRTATTPSTRSTASRPASTAAGFN